MKTWAPQLYDTRSSPSRPAQRLPPSHALRGLLKGKDCVCSVPPHPVPSPRPTPGWAFGAAFVGWVMD